MRSAYWDRIGRVAQHVGQGRHGIRAERLGWGDHLWPVEGFNLVVQHVLGQGENHRTGAARAGGVKGAGDIFGNPSRIVDPRRPFGERREHRGEIDFLKALAVAVVAGDIADKKDHRGAVLHRGMDADAGIGRAGATGDKGDTGLSSHLAVGLCHEGGAAVLAGGDGLDGAAVVQRVEHREEAFPGDGEDALGALNDQLVDENLCAGAFFHCFVLHFLLL